MNIEYLLAAHRGTRVQYALTGAKGGFARTLLAQTTQIEDLHASVLCDLDPEGARALALEVGFAAESVVVCGTPGEVLEVVAAGRTAVVASRELLLPEAFDILVEATGDPGFGYRVAADALRATKPVAMVSKEVDSVAGIELASIARENGVVYTPASGDQPANLIALVSWVRTLGLDIVAIGKSSEYDLVFDPAAGTVTHLDKQIHAPQLGEHLVLGDDIPATLRARAEAVAALPTGATADYCEMAVVANHTGFVVDDELMHYPVARISELADIYAPKSSGGVIERTGVVDVFSVLRTPDEASFGGGVFVVVRTFDAQTWEVLRGKGHVVSRSGEYACIYLPYHFMGVETPMTLLLAVHLGVPYGSPEPTRSILMAGRAKADLAAGTLLEMGGHHHDVTGVQAVLLEAGPESAKVAPLYVASRATLARDVRAGELILIDDLADHDAELLAAWTGNDVPEGSHV